MARTLRRASARGPFESGRGDMCARRYDARLAARPAIARGTLAGCDGAVTLATLLETASASDAEVSRVVHAAPSRAVAILASGARLARDWAGESSELALRPPRAVAAGYVDRDGVFRSALPAVRCEVNADSLASAGASRGARAWSLAHPDGVTVGEAPRRRTRRKRRGGRGRG